MARFNVIVLFALVLSALLMVTSQHRARKLAVDLESALGQEQELQVQTRQLELKISEFAKASLIDRRVRKELNMISLTPERTLYLPPPDLSRPDPSVSGPSRQDRRDVAGARHGGGNRP